VGDNNPAAILAGKVSIAKGTTEGWKSQSCDITISPETIYWIAAQCDDTATATNLDRNNDAGEKNDILTSVTELPADWGVSNSTLGRLVAIYAVWEAAPAGGGQVITIQMTAMPLFLMLTFVCFVKRRKAA
ncbi:hypothetical protein LCGC14_1774600, partial [marine sediment metagenome]